MREDERKPLTVAAVQKRQSKLARMTLALSLGGGILTGLAVKILITSAIDSHNSQIAVGQEGVAIWDILPHVLPWGILLVVSLVQFVRAARVLLLIKQNRLAIHEDELTKTTVLFPWLRHPIYRLKLATYGTKTVDQRTYDKCAVGDTMYVVVLHGRRNTVVDVFSPLTHRRADE